MWAPGDPGPALVASEEFVEHFRTGDPIALVDDLWFAGLPAEHPFYRDPPFRFGSQPTILNDQITVDLPGGATMEFVWVEPGTFVMGTSEEQQQLLDDHWSDNDAVVVRRRPVPGGRLRLVRAQCLQAGGLSRSGHEAAECVGSVRHAR